MGRLAEARERIDAAFAVLGEVHDYPPKEKPGDEVAVAMHARADYESDAGDRKRAVAMYEQFFAALMAGKPDPEADLSDAAKVSMMYGEMARVCRRANDAGHAEILEARRLRLWQDWNAKLPHNVYVQRQLTLRSE